MNLDDFWSIVDRLHRRSGSGVDIGTKEELLQAHLRRLSLDEVLSFDAHFTECLDRAYTWELWAAAFIIGGGCSDDAFWDFRSSLISMGRATYERALADPESLAVLNGEAEELFYQGFQYVAPNVAEELGGMQTQRSQPHPEEPSGQKWDEQHVAGMYPKLHEQYD